MRHRNRPRIDEGNEIMQKIITSLETSSNNHNYWRTIPEIATISGLTNDEASRFIQNSDEFARNNAGKYTTRTLYRRYTRLLELIRDAYVGKII